MEHFRNDLKLAFRGFRHHPGFTLTVIATMALGIGLSTAVFSVVNRVLLRPLRFAEPDRLVQFLITGATGEIPSASIPKFAVWREQTDAFEIVAGYNTRPPAMNLTGDGQIEQVRGVLVTGDYFRLLGAPVALGRTFTAEEDAPKGPRVVVVGHRLWVRRFGSDPGLVGRAIQINGEPHTVVGIIGPGFDVDPMPDVWLPFQFDLNSIEQFHFFTAAGRLRPGVSIAMARAQLKLAEQQFRRKFPAAMAPQSGFSVRSFHESVVGDIRPSLLVLLAAVGFVVVIAATNVSSLLLLRATGRIHEVALRAALGASRRRIVAQLLTETLTLFVISGVVGLALGAATLRVLLAINPGTIPRIGQSIADITLDWHVLAFGFAVAIGAGLMCGLFPALSAARADLNAPLKEGGARIGSGRRGNRIRAVLVGAELCLTVMLLIGAALLVRSFIGLSRVDPGFASDHVLTMQMSLNTPRLATTNALALLVRNAVERLEALPNVTAAAAANSLPLESSFIFPIIIAGRPLGNSTSHGVVGYTTVSSRFFDVHGVRLLRGRLFDEHDGPDAAPVVLINKAMADRFWPTGDALDASILIGQGLGPRLQDRDRRIVGIVSDIRDVALNVPPRPIMYVLHAQVPDGVTALLTSIRAFHWFVKYQGDRDAPTAAVQQALQQVSGGLAVGLVRTMDEVVVRSTAAQQLNAVLLTLFSVSAFVLAIVGLFGLVAYAVQQRTAELSIRMALGADRPQIRNLVLAHGLRLTLVGVVAGTIAALPTVRLLTSLLYGVKPWDPFVFAAVPLAISAASIVAIWRPAWRASRISAVEALLRR